MRSREGSSSMNTIDLSREIMQEDLPEYRRDPDRFWRKVVRRRSVMFTRPHSSRWGSLYSGSLHITSRLLAVDQAVDDAPPHRLDTGFLLWPAPHPISPEMNITARTMVTW